MSGDFMARIWQEGFENGLPNSDYLEGSPATQFHNELTYTSDWEHFHLSTGRTTYSKYSLVCSLSGGDISRGFIASHNITGSLNECYLRCYFKYAFATSYTSAGQYETIAIRDTAGNYLLSLYGDTFDLYQIRSRISDTYSSRVELTLGTECWYKVEMYIKIGVSDGAYEVRINDTAILTASSINTGSLNIGSIIFGCARNSSVNMGREMYYDDIALNDTSGTVNNSWCGSGTIMALKPKAAGTYSQWDTCQGYATAEALTDTTTLIITGHGLSTDDVIYNKTRNAYRIVTVSDVNTLTMTAITGQVAGDEIVAFTYNSTISAGSGTSTSKLVIPGHNLESYEVFVNTTRSDSIRRVIYIDGNDCYNYVYFEFTTVGSQVSSQTSGDSIKTFKLKQFAITNHYDAVTNATPNPMVSNIQTTTLNDIDTFDMEELVADKGITSNSSIVAVSSHIYAKEMGAGSQMKPVLRIDSTDYEGSTITLQGGTLDYQTIYDVSPDTSTAWSISEIDAIEAGVKLV